MRSFGIVAALLFFLPAAFSALQLNTTQAPPLGNETQNPEVVEPLCPLEVIFPLTRCIVGRGVFSDKASQGIASCANWLCSLREHCGCFVGHRNNCVLSDDEEEDVSEEAKDEMELLVLSKSGCEEIEVFVVEYCLKDWEILRPMFGIPRTSNEADLICALDACLKGCRSTARDV